jgi:NhaP-type Na+/H+ or K+/H+ antiporter
VCVNPSQVYVNPTLVCVNPTQVRNAAVMCWGGLRGAVGLALALVISLEKHFSEHDRCGARTHS